MAAWATALCAIYAGGIAHHVKLDSYHKSYLPAISFLKANTKAEQMIIGPGVLGFGLRYPPNLTDDFRIGFLSGKSPEWIVVNDWYVVWFQAMKDVEPDAYQFVRNRLDHEYKPVYNQAGYTIYRKP